jgi:hypothetical protein
LIKGTKGFIEAAPGDWIATTVTFIMEIPPTPSDLIPRQEISGANAAKLFTVLVYNFL